MASSMRTLLGKSPPEAPSSGRIDVYRGAAPSKRDDVSPAKRDIGTGEALGRGVASGVTANFYDELRGLHEAGGAAHDEPMSIYSVLRGAAGKMSGDKEAQQKYDAAVARERDTNKQAEEQHPAATLIGNVAGGLALPVGGSAMATTKAARAGYGAAIGAGYGGAFGAGEGDGLEDRARRAAGGAVLGGAMGAAAPTVIDAAGKVVGGVSHVAGSLLGHPIDVLRGIRNPDAEATRRIGGALAEDINAGKAGMSPADIDAAKRNGQSVTAVDLGGENVRAVGRSSANNSPTGRAALDDMTSQRFESQSARASNFVRGLSPFGGDATRTSESIHAAANAANKPTYDRVMSAHPVVTVPSEITNRPAVAQAMTDAVSLAKNYGEKIQGENEIKTILKGDGYHIAEDIPNSAKTSLKYWDYVKKGLDARIEGMKRSGGIEDLNSKQKADFAGLVDARKALVAHLDKVAPEYKDARAGAAAFFGAENAVEAGQNFVKMSGSLTDARLAHNKMNDAQKSLFAEGFVSDLADKISKISDNRSITIDKIFNSTDGKARINLALGPAKAAHLETFLRIEDIHDLARKMLGNSTTARQAIEAHLASGAGKTLTSATFGGMMAALEAYSTGQIDSKTFFTFAVTGGLSGGRAFVNTKVARRIGELLASDRPHDIIAITRMVANNHQVGRAIRGAETAIEKLGGQHAPTGILPGSPTPVGAQDDQNKRNR
jgi:hypothetical protein